MSRSIILSQRIKEVFLTGKWIANTNFLSELTQINYEIASQKVGNHNTIALLTQHVLYYITGIRIALESGKLEIRDKFSFDFEEILNEDRWNKLVIRFENEVLHFCNSIEMLSNDQLDSDFFDAKYGTCERNIEGMIEHGYYHLGQIVLIRKLIRL